jgi:hypothetical protein
MYETISFQACKVLGNLKEVSLQNLMQTLTKRVLESATDKPSRSKSYHLDEKKEAMIEGYSSVTFHTHTHTHTHTLSSHPFLYLETSVYD